VELSVNANHKKPELDGQFGELGPFQATKQLWAVRPDHKGLWDVKVDGSPCPVSLRSVEVLDETSGEPLRDPVRISAWDRVNGEKALYAAIGFKQGMVILEDEPAMLARAGDTDPFWLWHQFKSLSSDQQSMLLDLTRGPEYLWRFWKRDGPRKDQREISRKNVEELSENFHNLKPTEQDQAFNIIRRFDNNFFVHRYMDGGLVYLVLARINHSCRPNALTNDPKVVSGSHEPCKKLLIAKRDIAENEEITISYLDESELLEPLAERRKRLRRFGFECTCVRCVEEDANGDALLRRFRCTADSSCSGVHGAGSQGLLPCSSCGASATDSDAVLSTEEMHVSVYASLTQNLLSEKPLTTPDPFVEFAEGALSTGLAPDHWIVCKARDILSCFYEKGCRFQLAAENLQPIMDLSERVLGDRGWLRVESLADHHMQLGRFAEAFDGYVLAMQAVKRASPEHPVGQHFRCERIRGKLRSAIDARTCANEEAHQSLNAKPGMVQGAAPSDATVDGVLNAQRNGP
jgi:hypothetical protein